MHADHQREPFQARINTSAILIGDDKDYFSTNLRVGKAEVYASGFHILDSLETGSVITLRRDGRDSFNQRNMRVTQIRAYEVPNLLQLFGATVLATPTPV